MNNKIFIFTIGLCVILLAESIWAINYLGAQNQNKPSLIQEVQEKSLQSKLTLATPNNPVATNLQFPVTLQASPLTDQPIQALDAVVNFDPQIVQVVDINPLLENTIAEYALLNFDNDKGIIKISVILPEQPLNGETAVAQINFLPVNTGQTDIVFAFEKNQTTDSNVVLQNQTIDSLGEVVNLNLNIQ